ncbi:Uncharacterised protein [Clostridium sporogenes]|uniref:Nucleotidyltransferase domain-containing protein n=1 Tax=Clostridium sporogenes TaxID=1509 RepID=A0A7U4JRX3_CLOSG|nr:MULTISPECIES: nucleotidyltransferase domain-containing protein [Clostridium]AVP61899.1 hypothetical protein C7M79_14870 [Clostridium botulinum]AKC64206.1 nucleotidyltransferase domain-containing protein [Clostridium sporogenes]AKJ91333.1 DNA polymerase III subunit beta [Clostridium sporogenes]KCZ66694.1 nucleotidyltransferase domain-containing protein [Clostridium sporogenes]MDU7251289.1 nucleotidyltransferase domain-containing protein [Clostridium sp.]
MIRPYVNLKSENKINDFMLVLQNNIKKFESLEGVIGITLNGGMSRGYADYLSEIDIVIYLDKRNYELWNNGKSPIPIGITMFKKCLYDIKILNLEEEKQKSWDSVALWDLSYAKVLYDPNGEIKKLISDKLMIKTEPLQAEGLLFGCWWYFRLAGDIWIHRGDIIQGHYMLNSAVTKLIEALFIANGEYIPHEKWIIHFSRTLPWTPIQWNKRLLEAMSTGDLSLESLIKRQSIIEKLWEEVDLYIAKNECPKFNLRVMQKTFYDLLKLLLQNDFITVEEWNRKASLSLLSEEPFFSFVTVINEKIVIDKEKAFSIKPEDLYYWHYEILEKVLSEI